MRRLNVFLLALAALLSFACSESSSESAEIEEVTIEQAASMFSAGAVAVDANGAGTRSEMGVIPGARLLTSSGRYDPATELPSDTGTELVFYCGNTNCRASDGAAERAREAGYENVNVMREGIAGWVEAGNETAQPQS
ncbi:MAG: rhodanese-like domain-containing protein [Sandaracinaceae bacterium]